MNKKFITFLIALCSYGFHLNAQWAKALIDVPATIPPSPTASQLGKYGAWPVNYYTGLPNIDIPLYTINSGDLNVPVSLSYHASGIKVEEVASWVGAGWSLNAGGVITRSVKGIADEDINGYLSLPQRYKGKNLPSDVHAISGNFDVTSNFQDLQVFSGIVNNVYDSEPDVFYFNFNGKSGQFFMDENGEFHATKHSTLMIKNHPIFIDFFSNANKYWEIIDEQGVTYILGRNNKGTEHSRIWSRNPESTSPVDEVITAWYLNSIISPGGKDTVHFVYSDKYEQYNPKAQQVFRIPTAYFPRGTGPLADFGYGYNDAVTRGVKISEDRYFSNGNAVLAEIKWKHGSLKFVAQTNRKDITGKCLDKVELYNDKAQLLRTYELKVDNLFSRLFLSELNIKSTASELSQNYKFEYYKGLPDIYSDAQDYWGYYNAASNTHLIPDDPMYDMFTYANLLNRPRSNREPNADVTAAGSLKRIYFPTGGFTEFEFENHLYSRIGDGFHTSDLEEKMSGGLRIKSIKSFTEESVLVDFRSFSYGKGILLSKPVFTSVAYQSFYSGSHPQSELCLDEKHFIFTSTPHSQAVLGTTQGSIVGYREVTEYLNKGAGGKIDYEYSFFDDEFSDVKFHQMFQVFGRPVFMPSTSNDYKRGLLLKQVTYKKDSILYRPVKSVENIYNYNDKEGDPHFYNLKVLKVKKISDSSLYCTWPSATYFAEFRKLVFAFGFYSIKSAWPKLIRSVEKTFDDNSANYVSNENEYYYDNLNHLNATKAITRNSKGQTITSLFKYPHDIISSESDPGGFYSDMIKRNMVNNLVEQSTYNGADLISKSRTNFKTTWADDRSVVAPEFTQTQLGTSPLETRLKFYNYDEEGNILELSKEGDVHHSYIWDYKKTFATAEVVNGTFQEIAYTSFESDGTGNWNGVNFALTGTSPHCITGEKYYTIDGVGLSKSGLSANKTYMISYWSLEGALSIAGTHHGWPKNVRTVVFNDKSWTCWEHKVSGIQTVIVSGRGAIDELRLFPVDAKMSTYTYDPLLGMTSANDFNNNTVYYEYDSFGRLKLVRDKDKNIIKKICYNYAGQPENCDVYTNADFSGNYWSQACKGDETANLVYVSVPAGMFTSTISESDANSMAQSYAQNYANQHGTCSVDSVSLYFVNNSTTSGYSLLLENVASGESFTFDLRGYGEYTLGNVPAGTYNVTYMGTAGRTLYGFGAGCDSRGFSRENISFFNVEISRTCNELSMYN